MPESSCRSVTQRPGCTRKSAPHLLDRGYSTFPERMQCDHDIEFISKEVECWAFEKQNVTMDFLRPGKPTDNLYVEPFIGKFRDECVSVNWFLSIEHAQQMVEQYRHEYKQFRPHSSLGDLTPEEFIQAHLQTPEYSTFECL